MMVLVNHKFLVLQITINDEAGRKFISLLKSSLNALSCCIELLPRFTANVVDVSGLSKDSEEYSSSGKNATDANTMTTTMLMTMKLLEEILHYLSRLINFAPEECVACLRQLLKYLFGRNYANGRYYPEFVSVYMAARARHWWRCGHSGKKEENNTNTTTTHHDDDEHNTAGRMTMINSKSCATVSAQGETTDHHVGTLSARSHPRHHLNCAQNCRPLSELWAAVMEFHTSKWTQGPDPELGKHIKLFEPLVIHCLTVLSLIHI